MIYIFRILDKNIQKSPILIVSVSGICYLGLALIAIRKIIIQTGTVGHNWDWTIPALTESLRRVVPHIQWVWYDLGMGRPDILNFPAARLHNLIGLLGLLDLSGDFASKFVLIISMVIAAVSMFCLSIRILRNKTESITKVIWISAFVAGLFYGFSPAMYGMFIGGAIGQFIAFALAPLFILLSICYCIEDNKVALFVAILTLTLMVSSVQIISMVVPITFVYLIGISKEKKKTFWRYFCILIFYSLFDFGWMMDIGAHLKEILTLQIPTVYQIPLNRSGPALLRVLTTTNFLDRNFFERSIIDQIKPLWTLIAYSLTVLGVGFANIRKNYRKVTLFWLTCYLIGVTIMAQENSTIGIWFWPIFLKIPGSGIFRSPQNLLFLTTFPLAILFGIATRNILEKIIEIRVSWLNPKIILGITIFAFGIFLFPWWWHGDIGLSYLQIIYNPGDYLDVFQLSPGYQKIFSKLANSPEYSRALFLPSYMSVNYESTKYQHASQGGDAIANMPPSPISVAVSPSGNPYLREDITPIDVIEKTLCNSDPRNTFTLSGLPNLLSILKINYIFARQDVLPAFDQCVGKWNPKKISELLNNVPELTRVMNEDYGDLYAYKDSLPLIYPANQSSVIAGKASTQLDLLSGTPYLSGAPAVLTFNTKGTSEAEEKTQNILAKEKQFVTQDGLSNLILSLPQFNNYYYLKSQYFHGLNISQKTPGTFGIFIKSASLIQSPSMTDPELHIQGSQIEPANPESIISLIFKTSKQWKYAGNVSLNSASNNLEFWSSAKLSTNWKLINPANLVSDLFRTKLPDIVPSEYTTQEDPPKISVFCDGKSLKPISDIQKNFNLLLSLDGKVEMYYEVGKDVPRELLINLPKGQSPHCDYTYSYVIPDISNQIDQIVVAPLKLVESATEKTLSTINDPGFRIANLFSDPVSTFYVPRSETYIGKIHVSPNISQQKVSLLPDQTDWMKDALQFDNQASLAFQNDHLLKLIQPIFLYGTGWYEDEQNYQGHWRWGINDNQLIIINPNLNSLKGKLTFHISTIKDRNLEISLNEKLIKSVPLFSNYNKIPRSFDTYFREFVNCKNIPSYIERYPAEWTTITLDDISLIPGENDIKLFSPEGIDVLSELLGIVDARKASFQLWNEIQFEVAKETDQTQITKTLSNIQYHASIVDRQLEITTNFESDSRQQEYLLINQEFNKNFDFDANQLENNPPALPPFDIEQYPNFHLGYTASDPGIGVIDAAFGIDFNGDDEVDGYIIGNPKPGKNGMEISLNLFEVAKRQFYNPAFSEKQVFKLIRVILIPHKLWGLDVKNTGKAGLFTFRIIDYNFSNSYSLTLPGYSRQFGNNGELSRWIFTPFAEPKNQKEENQSFNPTFKIDLAEDGALSVSEFFQSSLLGKQSSEQFTSEGLTMHTDLRGSPDEASTTPADPTFLNQYPFLNITYKLQDQNVQILKVGLEVDTNGDGVSDLIIDSGKQETLTNWRFVVTTGSTDLYETTPSVDFPDNYTTNPANSLKERFYITHLAEGTNDEEAGQILSTTWNDWSKGEATGQSFVQVPDAPSRIQLSLPKGMVPKGKYVLHYLPLPKPNLIYEGYETLEINVRQVLTDARIAKAAQSSQSWRLVGLTLMPQRLNFVDVSSQNKNGFYTFFFKDLYFFKKIGYPVKEDNLTSEEKAQVNTLVKTSLVQIDNQVINSTLKANQTYFFDRSGYWLDPFDINLQAGLHSNGFKILPNPALKVDLVELANKPNIPQVTNAEVTFTKINPTHYNVIVNAIDNFWLVFSQNFNPAWKAYIVKSEKTEGGQTWYEGSALLTWFFETREGYEITDHYLVNSYANGWFIPKTGKYQIILEYTPQRWFEAGGFVSFITIFAFMGIQLWKIFKKRPNKLT